MLRKSWLFAAVLSILPTLAMAATQVHVSGWLGPIVKIVIVLVIAGVLIWALRYWAADIPAPIGKILYFAVVIVALIIILVILLGLVGVSVT